MEEFNYELSDTTLNQAYDEFEDERCLVEAMEQFEEEGCRPGVQVLRDLAAQVNAELRSLPHEKAMEEQEQYGSGTAMAESRRGQFHFELQTLFERRSEKMGVRERIFRTRFHQTGTFTHGQNLNRALAQGMRRAAEELLDDPDIEDQDRVMMRFRTARYDNMFFHGAGLRAQDWRNDPVRVDAFLDDMARKLNSNEQFEPNESFQLEFVHVRASPSGGGVTRDKRPGHQASVKFRLKKKCVVKIPQDDQNLCCARAIVTAKAHVDKHPNWRGFQRGRTIQCNAAIALHVEAHVEPGNCGMDELTRLALVPSLFGQYRIVMVDANRAYTCFTFGEGDTTLAILHEDGHYDALTSLPGFFGQSYFCGRCLQPYNNEGQHACPNAEGIHCPACCQDNCRDYQEAYKAKRSAHKGCHSCRRVFYGDRCFELHASKAQDGKPSNPSKPSVCASRRKCGHCRKLLVGLKVQREHKCGWGECPSCRKEVDMSEHQCFIQVAEDPEELLEKKYQAQLAKRRRRARQQGGDARLGARTARANIEEGEETDEEEEPYHPPLLVFWDTEAMQDTGKHVANLVVGMTAEDDTPQIFQGPDCIDRFLEWLEVLTEEETRYVTALAHNFRGYDSYFVVDALHRRKQNLNQIRQGGKLLELTYLGGYVRFIDSLSFFAMPLASFTKTFGLDPTQFKKGHFPHLFNTPANAKYVGPLPPKEMYGSETMSKGGKLEFDHWYDEQVAEGVLFDMQRDLVEYCISDVKLLREGCLTFQRDFHKLTRFCPFEQMTIASACNRDLRLNRMEEHTIASEPVRGWRLVTNHSKVALEWLSWQEHQLRQAVWLACNQEEQQQHDDMANAYPEAVNTHHPLYRPRIQHARTTGEYRLPDTRWTVDGYDAETNTVFEFLGCYWHGCPTCYPQRTETYRRLDDRSMGQVYESTQLRLQSIRCQGYTVVTMWECDWQALKARDPDVAQFTQALSIQEPLVPRDAFFGGRTNAVHLYYDAKVSQGEEIRYYDYTSLYPWVNKKCRYPLGHPTILYQPPTTEVSQYFGLAQCTILPPRGLFHPVLPYRTHGKLTFPLCRACVEQDIEKALHDKAVWCDHADGERALTGTWCTPELEKAVEKGYTILSLHEVWHFPESKVGLFEDYVNTWLKLKTEASGWPSWCDTEDKKEQYVRDFEEHEGIQLESQKVAKNPGQRALAKMMLNSMWGKFGQQVNKMQVKEFTDPQAFCQFMDSDQHDVRYVSCLNEDRVEVHHRHENLCENVSPNLNIFVACFTTCWARLRLYEALELLNDRVLYFDTDSVIYVHRPNQPDPMLGDHLGDFTDELGSGQFIVEFCSGGPKNYGYRCNDGKTACKVKGFSLNVEGAAQLNYDVMRQNTLDELRRPLDAPRTKRITQARKIVRDAKAYALYTQPAHKDYRLVFNKRVLDPRTAMTYPYGYESPAAEDLENIETLADLLNEEVEQGFDREANHAAILASQWDD